jgi:CTP synthase
MPVGPYPVNHYIFVTGGVVSSLGKGLTTASLGAILEARGLRVTAIKLDPYINVDSGTMNPFQHGEVFVTEDGAETDLDLGHYERFLEATMHGGNCFTAGQIYERVIRAERKGEYLGATVQVIPHITDEIKRNILAIEKMGNLPSPDITLVEIGGTIGDIESQPFMEAIRQIRLEIGAQRTLFMHLTLVPYVQASGELKTKPTQHSVKEMRSIGLQPDVLLCRSQHTLDAAVRSKISLFTNVDPKAVISLPEMQSIYDLPEWLNKQKLDTLVMDKFSIKTRDTISLERWHNVSAKLRQISRQDHEVRIAMVGKYVDLADSYMSLNEAIRHASLQHGVRAKIDYVEAADLADGDTETLKVYDAILVPGGFGERGVEGMIVAARYARLNKVPYLGICMGMQIALIEYARNEAKMRKAHSTEFDPNTKYPVVALLEEWSDEGEDYGGTMRLGAQRCLLKKGTASFAIYGKQAISERHRHRYECNNRFVKDLESAGLVISGWSEQIKGKPALVEMIEVPSHPWYIACQFHPEFQSRPWQAHPLFLSYMQAVERYAVDMRRVRSQ